MTIIYTSRTCPYCKQAMGWMRINNVEFVEKGVNTDEIALNEMLSKNGGKEHIPTICHDDGNVIIGFSKKRMRGVFNIRIEDDKSINATEEEEEDGDS